ncbi:MAG: hypothetical protein ABUS57_07735 [Pseudomonadota bacterium]
MFVSYTRENMYDAAAYQRATMSEPTWLTQIYAVLTTIAFAALAPAPMPAVSREAQERAKRRAWIRHRRLERRMLRVNSYF